MTSCVRILLGEALLSTATLETFLAAAAFCAAFVGLGAMLAARRSIVR